MPETRKMPNAKFKCQPLSKNAKFEEFGTKNAKLATLMWIHNPVGSPSIKSDTDMYARCGSEDKG